MEDIKIFLARSNKASLISTSGKDSFNEITEGRINPGDRLLMTGPTLAGSLGDKNIGNLACLKELSDIEPMLKRSIKLPEAIPYSLIVVETQQNIIDKPKNEDKNVTENKAMSNGNKKSFPVLMFGKIISFLTSIKQWLLNIVSKTKRNYMPSFLKNIKQGWTNMWTRYVNPNPKQAIIVVIITTIIIIRNY